MMTRNRVRDILRYPDNVVCWMIEKTVETPLNTSDAILKARNYEEFINLVKLGSSRYFGISDKITERLIAYDRYWRGEGTLKDLMSEINPKGNVSEMVKSCDYYLLKYPVLDYIAFGKKDKSNLAMSLNEYILSNGDADDILPGDIGVLHTHISGPNKKVQDIVLGDVINLQLRAVLDGKDLRDVVYKANLDQRERIVEFIQSITKARFTIEYMSF